MERLTERMNDEINGVWVKEHDYISAAHRLADYEDTGLTPDEILELKALLHGCESKHSERWNRLQELEAADKGGRVIILPCKEAKNG